VTDGTVILVVYSELINHQTEIYDHLFRTAPDAMIIACPITNDAGHATDGWILMMNDRARHLLRFDGTIGNLRLTQLPQFAGVDLWGRLYAPKSAAAATPVTTADFDVEIMRFPHVFGLRISPKAARLDADAATLVPGMGAGQPVRLISRDRFACAPFFRGDAAHAFASKPNLAVQPPALRPPSE
jgi:PAS domain-containing protein